jgi:hypothetical protein
MNTHRSTHVIYSDFVGIPPSPCKANCGELHSQITKTYFIVQVFFL